MSITIINIAWIIGLLSVTILLGRFAFRDLLVKSFGVTDITIENEKDGTQSQQLKRNIIPSVIVIASMVIGFGVMIAKIIYDYKLQGIQYNIYNIIISIIACWFIILFTKVVFDKTVIKAVSKDKNKKPCTISVAIVDAGNILGTTIIVTKALSWSAFTDVDSIYTIFGVFVIAQVATILLTYVRKRLIGLRNRKFSLQKALAKGNHALAIRFAGRIIGNSIVISSIVNTIPSQLIIYEILITWMVLSVLFIGIVYLISLIIDSFIMYSVNTYKEIVEKNNIAVAVLQAIIYIAIGIVFHILWSAS